MLHSADAQTNDQRKMRRMPLNDAFIIANLPLNIKVNSMVIERCTIANLPLRKAENQANHNYQRQNNHDDETRLCK